ncbi:hypothetical protein AWENTII_005540 [Aspergillus wentii]
MASTAVRGQSNNIRVIKPILRAYALGYLSSTTPKVIASLRRLRGHELSCKEKLQELSRALTSAIRLNSFATFCGFLVGGSTVFPVLFLRLCGLIARHLGSKPKLLESRGLARFIRFVSALFSSWFSFQLLNRKPISLDRSHNSLSQDTTGKKNDPSESQTETKLGALNAPDLAGRTMDLTLFTLTRAVDSMVCIGWSTWRHRRKSKNRWTKAEDLLPQLADAGVFAASAAVVMWAWFYQRDRLPKSYGKWIGEAAQVDSRLVEALRRARWGSWVYGKDTGQAPLLESMCKDYGWPIEWGDPAKTIPLPCEMVHMDCGPSCEKHAAIRFLRTFKFACATYIPLQVAFRLRGMKSMSALTRTLTDALRSSAFLSSFVSIFYYSVCLARTRLGPKLFDRKTVTPMMWDSGLCVGAGCLMCGWSILVEKARKRQEVALFVAPRAAATVLPRLYNKKYQYRERIAFAVSAAIVFTCLQERPSVVRGVFGKIGTSVLK